MSDNTLRKKAYKAGYMISKGFRHWLNGTEHPPVYTIDGERFSGYEITDLATGTTVAGCDRNFDFLLALDEVETFLREVYEEAGMDF